MTSQAPLIEKNDVLILFKSFLWAFPTVFPNCRCFFLFRPPYIFGLFTETRHHHEKIKND